MDKNQRSNEGEMGSGESDDEFYNVNVPYTPATDKTKKMEVKKVYSPPRTKVKYDYKFDSSSDEESENQKMSKTSVEKTNNDNPSEKSESKREEPAKESVNLPQNTFKVVEKINEELKNMKNAGGKKVEKVENMAQTSMATSMASVARPPIGVVPPVVVVPPPMVVPQAPVMNMGPIMVSSVGMGGQNIMPGAMNMMSSQNMMGNMLRSPNPMGGLMPGMPNTMMGMNAMMGMQGGIVAGQGMSLQGGMINPAAMNMAMSGMRMPGAGNNMLRMPGGAMMGIARPNGNIMGVPRAMGVPGPPGSVMGMQNPSGGLLGNPGGMMVNPGSVMNNAMMGSPGLMVMGGMMTNPALPNMNPAAAQSNPSVVRMVNNPQVSPAVRGAPPPPFMNLRGKPPLPGNFRWQANPRLPGALPQSGSPVSSSKSGSNDRSPSSSPVDKGCKDYDGDDFSRDDKDKSLSDKSSNLETDESQSPPRELPNNFKNDGSFMEMFKKMKDESSQEGSSSNDKSGGGNDVTESSSTVKKPPVMLTGIVGKRRGGRVLKTGLVKKVKKENDPGEEKHPKDAWSMYMAEVKKYREASCEEEGKTRPLVK